MIQKTILLTLLITGTVRADISPTDALINEGKAALDAKDKEKTYHILKSVLAKDPDNFQALFYLGIAYYYDNNTTNAIPCLTKAFKLNNQNIAIARTLGLILNDHGDFGNALNILEVLHDKDRGNEQIKTKLLPLYLRAMDWYYALKLCSIDDLWWNNEPITGKNVLLDLSSQWNGLGDVLQIVRYAKHLTRAGAIVTVKVRAELIPLLSLCPYINTIINTNQLVPAIDKTYTLSTDRFVLRMRETLYKPSQDVPYLFAQPTSVEYWKNQLQNERGYKVGICWQSTKMRDYFTGTIIPGPRAMKLEQLMPLLKLKNISFYSLQHGEDAQIIQVNAQGAGLKSFKKLDADGAFMDTAAIMKNMDLIITVDTAIAHLAGGLGVPVWVMLPYAGDFRWFSDRDDSPFYPTMKLFRQPKNSDWQGLVENVTEKLKSFSQAVLKKG